MLFVEVQEDMREAVNNLVKHFHKPEQEVCVCVCETSAIFGDKIVNADRRIFAATVSLPLCYFYL